MNILWYIEIKLSVLNAKYGANYGTFICGYATMHIQLFARRCKFKDPYRFIYIFIVYERKNKGTCF